MQSKLIICHWY